MSLNEDLILMWLKHEIMVYNINSGILETRKEQKDKIGNKPYKIGFTANVYRLTVWSLHVFPSVIFFLSFYKLNMLHEHLLFSGNFFFLCVNVYLLLMKQKFILLMKQKICGYNSQI